MKMLINSIKFLEDFIIEIELIDKQIILYDMKPYMNTAKFSEIKNESIFGKGVLIENSYIKWDESTSLHDYEILGKDYIRKRIYNNF
jgi:hypothetical protein